MTARRAQRSRDPEATRARLLDAAVEHFAQSGFAGARTDAICRAADVNERMLYHYFGSKAGLYVAVLELLLTGLRESEKSTPDEPNSAQEALLGMFDHIYRHFGENPALIKILSNENIMSATSLKSSVAAPLLASGSLERIDRLLRRGLADGTIARWIDPLHLYVVMVAQAYFHRSNAPTLSHIWETNVADPGWQADHHRLARAMLRAMLVSPPADDA